MEKNKYFLYQVNPLFFRDGDGDGFGDFLGFIETIPYLKFMGINYVCFPDIFNNINSLNLPTYVAIEEKYGELNTLTKVIQELKNNNISFVYEINIKNISKSSLVKNLNKKHSLSKDKKDFYLDKKIGDDKNKKWDEEKNIFLLKKLLTILKETKIENIMISNFEFLFNKTEAISNNTIDLLKSICEVLKNEFGFLKVFVKSNFVVDEMKSDLISTNMIDLFINTSLNEFGINKNHLGFNKVEKFKFPKFFKSLENLLNNKPKNVLDKTVFGLSENKNGRIISRWGSKGILRNDSTKAFLSIILFSPTSFILYFGDELGLLNLDLKNFSELNDPYILDTKRRFESKGIKERDFWNSEKEISSINNNYYFPWNNSKNFGFTNNKNVKLFWKIYPYGFEQNVKEQMKNMNSSLNYIKKTIAFLNEENMVDFLENYESFEIKKKTSGLIKYAYKKNNELLIININLKNKWIQLNELKEGEIIFCSNHKREEKNFSFIMPYEVIITIEKI
ncbi:MAG: alpha-amylase family glycosyl hydrolase [Metamycoplasmataceae bacterium]